jgi:hypothetical protein
MRRIIKERSGAQRTAREPLGRLSRTRFKYTSAHRRTDQRRHQAEGQVGSTRLLGSTIYRYASVD